MAANFDDPVKREIWATLRALNDAWTQGNPDNLAYYYDMSFEMGGQTIATGGREMFFFVRENGRWWAAADQFSGYPA